MNTGIACHSTDVVVQLDSIGYPFFDFLERLWLAPAFVCIGLVHCSFLWFFRLCVFIITILQFDAWKGYNAFNRKLHCFSTLTHTFISHFKTEIEIRIPNWWGDYFNTVCLVLRWNSFAETTPKKTARCSLFTISSLRQAVKLPCKFIWEILLCVCVRASKEKSS